ncbi:MAG: glycosyltransferase, partial [Rhodospirillales bacterium]|nr:glycosyltransferase [Rhodospirillales bacterium]
FGAGVKMKVVEALRHGLPLVTTRVGAQGLPGLDRVAAVEDGPAGFAAALAALLTDDAAWAARSEAGLDYARTRFSAAAQTACLLEAFGAVA